MDQSAEEIISLFFARVHHVCPNVLHPLWFITIHVLFCALLMLHIVGKVDIVVVKVNVK